MSKIDVGCDSLFYFFSFFSFRMKSIVFFKAIWVTTCLWLGKLCYFSIELKKGTTIEVTRYCNACSY